MENRTFAKNFTEVKKMHELSIAMDIIQIVEDSARNAHADKVAVIDLEIGELSGIEIEALKMAMQVSVKGTVAADAELKIRMIQGAAHCADCGKDSPVDDLFSLCPSCGSFRMDIIRGKEMSIKSIVVESD
jgi:hydrogenase nickel incorporation protein HypA/HybF